MGSTQGEPKIVWNDASFKDYIKDPNAKVPGTKMIFPGIKNEKEADDLRAYLNGFGEGREKGIWPTRRR